MHKKAKDRIDAAEKARSLPSISLLQYFPETGSLYDTLKLALVKLCDDSITSGQLSETEASSIATLRSRVLIEL